MTRNRKGFGVGAVSVQERQSFLRVLQVFITPLNVSCLLPTGPYGQACSQLRKRNTKNNRQYFYNIWRRNGSASISKERSRISYVIL